MFMYYTSTTIVKIFECTPRERLFDPKIPGTCIDIPMLLLITGIFNIITDVIILLLPVKAVWDLKMQIRKKTVVVLVFTFGLA
jgi:hypothetical protein